jgi:hypothetical protein
VKGNEGNRRVATVPEPKEAAEKTELFMHGPLDSSFCLGALGASAVAFGFGSEFSCGVLASNLPIRQRRPLNLRRGFEQIAERRNRRVFAISALWHRVGGANQRNQNAECEQQPGQRPYQ